MRITEINYKGYVSRHIQEVSCMMHLMRDGVFTSSEVGCWQGGGGGVFLPIIILYLCTFVYQVRFWL